MAVVGVPEEDLARGAAPQQECLVGREQGPAELLEEAKGRVLGVGPLGRRARAWRSVQLVEVAGDGSTEALEDGAEVVDAGGHERPV